MLSKTTLAKFGKTWQFFKHFWTCAEELRPAVGADSDDQIRFSQKLLMLFLIDFLKKVSIFKMVTS